MYLMAIQNEHSRLLQEIQARPGQIKPEES